MAMPAKPEEEKHKQISITIPPEILQEIDDRLKEGESRSKYISDIMSAYLKRTKYMWLKGVESGQKKPV